MDDLYTNWACVSGTCPLFVEKSLYGVTDYSCKDYCGEGFLGCHNCYFQGSPECKKCVHYFENFCLVCKKCKFYEVDNFGNQWCFGVRENPAGESDSGCKYFIRRDK